MIFVASIITIQYHNVRSQYIVIRLHCNEAAPWNFEVQRQTQNQWKFTTKLPQAIGPGQTLCIEFCAYLPRTI